MRKLIAVLALIATVMLSISATTNTDTFASDLKAGFTLGDPDITSINKLTFGPEGILFMGDTKNAAIYALDTKDITPREKGDEIRMEGQHCWKADNPYIQS
ncbi:MAG: hypothetical protein AAF361_13110 [Bacteroidota bacterium]